MRKIMKIMRIIINLFFDGGIYRPVPTTLTGN
jgi:hypothetical protein